MPPTLTYSQYRPLTTQISTDFACFYPHRHARHDGSGFPRTYGVRLGPCGSFATEPCRPTACTGITAKPAPNVHCSLYIVHCWFYSFSAKERDNVMRMAFAVLPVLSAKQLHDFPFVDCEEDPQIGYE